MVIAYAAGRDRKLSTYAFNRITRLLSVLVPALLLTFLFDQIGKSIGPEAYTSFYNPALHLIDALFPAETLARDGLLLVGSIMVGLVFAYIFERRIAGFRECVLGLNNRLRAGREAKPIC